NKNSGPWLKDTLREIEIAVISNQIVNTKEEILEWVDAHVKI
ncbi:CCA tRNA nucleotidyltransferase, partial [Staphylococcus epidermidis]